MEKKYELTEETKKLRSGTVVHRIRALKDFGYFVHEGDLGGFIEKEENLSHEGSCWVYDNAIVYGNAKVYNNARVYDDSRVCDSARVCGYTLICTNAIVCGDAEVCDNSKVYGCAIVYKNAKVCGDARLCGNAEVSANANISSTNDVLCVGPIGSRNDYTTFYKSKDNTIMVNCGWFNDTIDVFEKQVKLAHKNNELWLNQYLDIITFAKKKIIIK